MLTKRNLLIIIGLLFLLDLAAFFVYIISHTNRDGKSPIEFVLPTDTVQFDIKEDTVPETLVADEFDTIARSENFVSKDVVPKAGKLRPLTCSVKMKFVWPKSINDEKNLDNLHEELIKRISPMAPSNVNDAVEWILDNPEFAQPCSNFVTASTVNSMDSICHTMQQYRIFPYVSTHYILEMVVLVEKLSGKSLSRKMNIVHYDRVHNKVVDIDQIFDISKEDSILGVINRNIALEKKKGNHANWHLASSMPTDFLLGNNSVVFLFSNGEIAPWNAGLHQVTVPNEELMPFFTTFYTDVLKKDNHFIAYKFISL